jgi:uncharacterized Rmd1/YagE family protein
MIDGVEDTNIANAPVSSSPDIIHPNTFTINALWSSSICSWVTIRGVAVKLSIFKSFWLFLIYSYLNIHLFLLYSKRSNNFMPDPHPVSPEPEQIFVKAFDVASSYDLRETRKVFERQNGWKVVETIPLLVQADPKKFVGVFDYGSIVFFNVNAEEQKNLLDQLIPHAYRLNKTVSEDDFTLTVGQKARNPEGTEELVIKDFTRDIALVVGTVLSRSVSVEYYEKVVNNALAQIEEPMAALQHTGRIPWKERELTRRVGFALSVEQELAYTLAVLDDPDIVWDGGKRIEELYRDLKRQFDLDDRIKILQEKVSIISRSSTFVISRLEAQRSQMLEWIIILLIVFEIMLVVFHKF